MGKHYDLARGETFIEPVPDALMELLGAATPSLNITVLNQTTLQVAADNDNAQQAVSINSRWRWNQSNATAAHPGGGAGTHSVYVTAADNDITPGDLLSATVDDTDYTFGLQIKTSGTPSTDLYRKVGEVEWDGSSITALRHMAGGRHENAPLTPTAPTQYVVPLKVKGAASQSANLAEFLNSAGTVVLAISPTGTVVLDDLTVGDDLTILGDLNHDGPSIGFYGATPVAQSTGWSVTNPSDLKSIDLSNYTMKQLARVVTAIVRHLVSRGDFAA